VDAAARAVLEDQVVSATRAASTVEMARPVVLVAPAVVAVQAARQVQVAPHLEGRSTTAAPSSWSTFGSLCLSRAAACRAAAVGPASPGRVVPVVPVERGAREHRVLVRAQVAVPEAPQAAAVVAG